MDVPIGRDAELIYQALGLPEKPDGLRLHGFILELDGSPFPLSRFSKQAKIESAWLDSMGKGLDRDFSWVRLKALYTGKS